MKLEVKKTLICTVVAKNISSNKSGFLSFFLAVINRLVLPLFFEEQKRTSGRLNAKLALRCLFFTEKVKFMDPFFSVRISP